MRATKAQLAHRAQVHLKAIARLHERTRPQLVLDDVPPLFGAAQPEVSEPHGWFEHTEPGLFVAEAHWGEL
jgi:hypothetical protein